jgi:hypothetical protein
LADRSAGMRDVLIGLIGKRAGGGAAKARWFF